MRNSAGMMVDRVIDLQVFVRVAELRSFTQAAEHLGLSRSAVGKSIGRLERGLGVRLLHRTTRSVSLTDEGASFHARCAAILADLEEAEALMAERADGPRGRLRLDMPVSFGRLHVMPLVHAYMRRYPEVAVLVSFTDRYVDLVEEGVDLAVRIGGAEESRLIARRLASHRLVTCAAPAYLDDHGVPQVPDDLDHHGCLAFIHGGRPVPWRLMIDGRDHGQPVRGRFCASNAEVLRDAALAGYGVAQLPTFLVGADLRDGRLRSVLDGFAGQGDPIQAVYPTGRHLSPKVRTLIDMITAAWRDLPPWDRALDNRAADAVGIGDYPPER